MVVEYLRDYLTIQSLRVRTLPAGTSTGIGRSEAEAIGHLILAIALQHPNEWPGLEVERK